MTVEIFDAECQIVKGWARSSAASGTHSFYRWMDGELVLVREIDFDFTKKIVVKDLLDGQMAEVYHEEWEEKDADDVSDVLHKWNSLDYHGAMHNRRPSGNMNLILSSRS